MRVLNLYAGIGGNRMLWNEVDEDIQVTAVEYDENIAKVYATRFPGDTVVVADAKEYLLEHFREFDFIWASPPCQTHSRARSCRVKTDNVDNRVDAKLPDLSLYEVVLFLREYHKGKWVVENVIPFYKPIIKQTAQIDRHYYWSNFNISNIQITRKVHIEKITSGKTDDIDLKGTGIKRKDQVIRNQVDYDVGKYIFECAANKVTFKEGSLF